MTAAQTLPTARPMPAERNRKSSGPERRCIVTRESGPRGGLIRFVAGPDGKIVPDLAERLPGRGLWLTAERDIVAQAVAKNAFSRAARRSLSAPQDLPDRIEQLLVRRCLDLLSMANRAGLVRAGLEKARAAVDKGSARLLLTAADGGRDAEGLAAAAARADDAVPARRLLTRAELGGALGRDMAVNVALRPGGLTETLGRELDRLAGFRRAAQPAGPPASNGGGENEIKPNSDGDTPSQVNG